MRRDYRLPVTAIGMAMVFTAVVIIPGVIDLFQWLLG